MKTKKNMSLDLVLSSAKECLRVNVIAQRARLHLTQRDLSERAGLARAVISKIESGSGDVNVSTVAKIAYVVGCEIGELLAPVDLRPASDAELRRRLAAPSDEWESSDALFAAIREARGGRGATVAGSVIKYRGKS